MVWGAGVPLAHPSLSSLSGQELLECRSSPLDHRPAHAGTTDEERDAWFGGFTPELLAGVWVGFDERRMLGRGEEGAHTALPIWTEFMVKALAGTPVTDFTQPPGIVVARIDPTTGLLAAPAAKASSCTGCTEALPASRTLPLCALTTIICSTRVAGPSSERRTEICSSARRTDEKCQRYLRAKSAKMRACS